MLMNRWPIVLNGRRFINKVSCASIQKKVYPPAKAMVWNQCEKIFEWPILMLMQINNVNVSEMQRLRHLFRTHGALMRFPKPSILRAFIRSVPQWRPLEPAIVGSMCCVMSQTPDLSKLQPVIDLMRKEEGKFLLVGGKIERTLFSADGLCDAIARAPTRQWSLQQIYSLLLSPSQSLARQVEAAGMNLFGSLISAHSLKK